MVSSACLRGRSRRSGKPGDVFFGISTSGNSPNVLRALELCRDMGIATIGLTGKRAAKCRRSAITASRIPSDVTMYIQQAHLALEHIFCMLVERAYFGVDDPPQQNAATGPVALKS